MNETLSKKRIIKICKYYYPQFKILFFWRFYLTYYVRRSSFFTYHFGKGKPDECESFCTKCMAEKFIDNEIKKEIEIEKNKNHEWCMKHDKIYRECFYNKQVIVEYL